MIAVRADRPARRRPFCDRISHDPGPCRTIRVKEWKGEVVFLHGGRRPGTADRSYGIHRRPAEECHGARQEVLGVLEKGEQGGALARLADDLPLFSTARRRAETVPPPIPGRDAIARDPARRAREATRYQRARSRHRAMRVTRRRTGC